MPWDHLDQALIGRVRAYLEARAEHPSLRSGGRYPLLVSDDVLAMVKEGEGEIALVAVNLGDGARTIELGSAVPVAGEPELTLGAAPPKRQEGGLTWELPPLTTAVAVWRARSSSPADTGGADGRR